MCECKPKIKAIVEAGWFPYEPFHADMAEDWKEEMLDDFRSGRVRVIVASGASGMGIDIQDIWLIVHMDEPRNMRDYGQASGQAGRDGLQSRAMIIRGGLQFHDRRVLEFMDPKRTRCRRIGKDAYLDGDGTREALRHGGSAVRSSSAAFAGASHAGGSDDAAARAVVAAFLTDAAGTESDGVAGTIGKTVGGVQGVMCDMSRPRARQHA